MSGFRLQSLFIGLILISGVANANPAQLINSVVNGVNQHHIEVHILNKNIHLTEKIALNVDIPNTHLILTDILDLAFKEAQSTGEARVGLPTPQSKGMPTVHIKFQKQGDEFKYYLEVESEQQDARPMDVVIQLSVMNALTKLGGEEKAVEYAQLRPGQVSVKRNGYSLVSVPLTPYLNDSDGLSEEIVEIVAEVMSHGLLNRIVRFMKVLDQVDEDTLGTEVIDEVQQMVEPFNIKGISDGFKGYLETFISPWDFQATELERKVTLMRSAQQFLQNIGLASVIETNPTNPDDVRMRFLHNEGTHPLNKVAKLLWPRTVIEYSPLSNMDEGSYARFISNPFGQKSVVELGDEFITLGFGFTDGTTLHEVIHAVMDALRAEGNSPIFSATLKSAKKGQPFDGRGGPYSTFMSFEEMETFLYQLVFSHLLETHKDNVMASAAKADKDLFKTQAMLRSITFMSHNTLKELKDIIEDPALEPHSRQDVTIRNGVAGFMLKYGHKATVRFTQNIDPYNPGIKFTMFTEEVIYTDVITDPTKIEKFHKYIRTLNGQGVATNEDIEFLTDLMADFYDRMDLLLEMVEQRNHAVFAIKDKPVNDPSWQEIKKIALTRHPAIDTLFRFYERNLQLPDNHTVTGGGSCSAALTR